MPTIKDIDYRHYQTISLWLSRASFAALLFVWSLPGVIALRNSLIGLLLLTAIVSGTNSSLTGRVLLQRKILWPILLLSAWIAIHNSLLAWEPRSAWQESMQWFKALTLFVLGAMLAGLPPDQNVATRRVSWLRLVLVAYFGYLVIDLVLKPWAGEQDFSTILLYTKGLASRDLASYLGTTLVAILLADISGHLSNREGVFAISLQWRVALLLGATSLTLATMTRNSLPVLVLMAFLAGSVPFSQIFRRQKSVAILMLLVATIVMVGAASFSSKHDSRWSKLSESISLGLDTANHKTWLNQFDIPYPVDASGRPVDDSAYLRTAWMKGLIEEIASHPLGVGYDRNAFGRALRADYGDWVKTGHGHSGLLDFTLGVGIPGGVLFVAFLVGLAKVGYDGWRRHASAASLALLLFALSYASRSVLDGTVRDHMLEQFMLLAGLMLGFAHEDQAIIR